MRASRESSYARLIEDIFLTHFVPGADEIVFDREELVTAAAKLGVQLPKNLGDVPYTFRYRKALPEGIRKRAPEAKEWIIRPAGVGRYRFVAVSPMSITPNPLMAETKVPDATPD